MDEETLAAAENVLKRCEKAGKFLNKYGIMPNDELKGLYDEMAKLADTLPEIAVGNTRDELLQRELRLVLAEQMAWIESIMTPKTPSTDLGTLVQDYQIPLHDIKSIQDWLILNRTATLEAIDRLYKTREVEGYTFHIDTCPTMKHLVWNMPRKQEEIIAFAEESVERYHTELGSLMEALTNAGESLEDIIVAPTSEGRSYFDSSTKTLALSIPAICVMDEAGKFHLDEEAIIGIYGHEIGHALNTILTDNAIKDGSIPLFIGMKRKSAKTTMEAVAQFYEKQILEDLKGAEETQEALKTESPFKDIYQEVKDTELMKYHWKMLQLYCLLIHLNPSFGDMNDNETKKKKLEAMSQVELTPGSTYRYIQNMCTQYNNNQLSEIALDMLFYCSKPVERALDIFREHKISYDNPEDRSLIDQTFLTGYWTAKGFEDNARLVAEEHSKKKKPQS